MGNSVDLDRPRLRTRIRRYFSRAVEEPLPLVTYLYHARKKRGVVKDLEVSSVQGPYARYFDLGADELMVRINEERDRAKSLDEKTFKMTLAISVGLTILGTTRNVLAEKTPLAHLRPVVSACAFLAIFYILTGGAVALSALKTAPSFGYGTDFRRYSGNRRFLVENLAKQELMNLVRHMRNECVYQHLRNGFLFLLVALLIFGGSHAWVLLAAPPGKPVAPTGGWIA